MCRAHFCIWGEVANSDSQGNEERGQHGHLMEQ